MQKPKSRRHVAAAAARWRRAAERAEYERSIGTPDRQPATDCRLPIDLDLRSAGYRRLRIEPRYGYLAWRAIDADTNEVLHCAALKQVLHWIAAQVPRMMSPRMERF